MPRKPIRSQREQTARQVGNAAEGIITAELLSQLPSLELRARLLVESVLTGTHRGNQRGFSIDFAEHRDYSPGDDVRYLDWKLYGKRDRFYVRQFEDEKQLQVWVLLDVSGSMSFRSADAALSKLETAATLAAAVAWIAAAQRDLAGVIRFAQTATSTGPVFGTAGVLQLIELLEQELQERGRASEGADLEDWPGLRAAAQRVPPRSLVLLLTDAFGETTTLKQCLLQLKHKHCDVRVAQLLDPAELSLPYEGAVVFRDLEGGSEQQVVAQTIREGYQTEVARFLEQLRELTTAAGSRYTLIDTSRHLLPALHSLLDRPQRSP